MLDLALQITGTIALAGGTGWICYLVGHMHGAAEQRRRDLRDR